LDGVDKKWSWEWVKNWDNATVDYIGRLEDGTVFETTIRSIAEACDIYDETIDYTQWYEFNVGVNQMIKWFDEWVIWMKVWQTKTVEVSPENWYWVYNKNNVVKYTADEIWDLSKYTEWQTIYLSMWVSAKVLEVTDKYVTLDFNHELAGKTLIFDITLKAIN
jgi:peptidylprolyl isomerase